MARRPLLDPPLHEEGHGSAAKLRWLLSTFATGKRRRAIRREIGRDGQSRVTTLAEAVSDMMTVLEAVAATESIRRAAQLVHMHHNTVAQRVRDAENVLGYPLTEPCGRTRLMVGLILYCLSAKA